MLWLVLGFATLAEGAAFDAGLQFPAELKPERYEAQAAHLAAEVLSRYHYKATPLDQALSGKIFDQCADCTTVSDSHTAMAAPVTQRQSTATLSRPLL